MASIELIKLSGQHTSAWSGGTTTQIAIYPKNAVYSNRNFQWRLSSAKVELEESVFTSLPGIQRVIMVIEGEMRLLHEGHHSVYLRPFEQDTFSGNWLTKSFGKVRDFNLMLAQDTDGALSVITVPEASDIQISGLPGRDSEMSNKTTALYCVDGKVSVLLNEKNSYQLHEGDVLLIHSIQPIEKINCTIKNRQTRVTHIIRADIYYPDFATPAAYPQDDSIDRQKNASTTVTEFASASH